MQGMPPVAPGADSDLIFDAFREFVRIHQILLNTLIGKAGLFTTVPFVGAPVAAVLRQIEKIVDTLAFTLIDTLQGRMSEVKEQGDMLDATVEQGIKAFGGVDVMDTVSGLLGGLLPGSNSMPAQPAASMAPMSSMPAETPSMITSMSSATTSASSSTPAVPTLVQDGTVMMPIGSMPLDGTAFTIQAAGENVVCSCSNGPSSRVKRSALAF